MAKYLEAGDVIKAAITEEEPQVQSKIEKPSPFAFLTAVSETKKDIVNKSADVIKDYVPYITNRGFSFFPDSVLHANDMNLYTDIPAMSQYYYYMASLRKRSRKSKWFKLEKNDDLELVKNVYQVRSEIAKQYLKLLSKDDIAKLRQLTDTGGEVSKTNPKKNK
jgi:uncharacterized protein with NRDE domain